MPTEAEIQTQWKNGVAVLEDARVFGDAIVDDGGEIDTLVQSLEGDFLPTELSAWTSRLRAAASSMVDPVTARELLEPILFEYAAILSAGGTDQGFGSGFTSVDELATALYEWFVDTSVTVKSRTITYGSPTVNGTGNGTMTRLTEDENGFDLEACHVEKKLFRCRADANSGVLKEAEVFEVVGQRASFDALRRTHANFGSGGEARRSIVSKNAGAGQGGSVLNNSSFSTFDATASPKFANWTESAGGGQLAQATGASNIYRSHPGATTDASMRINGGGGTVTVKQAVSAMRVQRLDPNRPYFFRIMVNGSVGSALDGNVTIRLGSQSATVLVSALSAGWNELMIAADQNTWFRSFNEDGLDAEIEWSGSTSGYVLVDDAILIPYDEVDGTYLVIRAANASPVAWEVDDTIRFTDTGGAPATGKIQYWFWVALGRYLPSSGTPTFTDP